MTKEQKTLLIVLTAINFLNYLDRQVIFPLFDAIKTEFHISDFQLGLLGTAFLLVHSLATLPLGIYADRVSRKMTIAWGVAFWSVMTFASGLAQSFKALLGIRAAVGIGEASYAPAATAMISDAFPEGHRAQAQGVWNAGMFIGGTLGAMIGGSIIALFGNWRIAFFLVAIPGALLAWMASRLPEKKREHREPFHIKELLTNIPYLFIVGSSILLSFAAGSYISWGIEFVVRYKGFSVGSASLLLGLDMMVAGLMGVVIGSIVADHWHTKGAWGRSLVVAISLILAAPFMFLGIWSPGESISFFVYFFIGTVLLAAYHGPATAVIHDIVPERARATAFAMYLFVGHLLGDTLAPAAIGFISDSAGLLRGLEYATILVFFGGILFLPVAWYAGAAIERAKKT